MKNLTQIPDRELLSIVKTKVENERQLTLEVIDLLREVHSRRLHLKRGFSSLHEFCVKELRYSDGAAFRRIKAMRLVEDMPEVMESIQSGSLSLTTVSQLQTAFETKAKEQNPMTIEQKVELVSLVQNQSRREVERTLAKVCPEVIKVPERVRAVNESQVKVELVIEGELFKKIEKLKALTSHKNKNLVELLENLVDQELRRKDPELKSTRQKSLAASPAKANIEAVENKKVHSTPIANNASPIANKASPSAKTTTRYISSTVKHYVWMRDKGRCTYFDPLTKRKCENKFKLTFEHVQPYSMGGENTADNLRLLCANHNRLTAMNVFGEKKMNGFSRGFVVKT